MNLHLRPFSQHSSPLHFFSTHTSSSAPITPHPPLDIQQHPGYPPSNHHPSKNMTSKTPLNSALFLAISAIAFVALTSATSISISATSTFRTEIVRPSATIAAAAFNGTTLTNLTTYQWPGMVGESRLETRDKPARPESLCHGISPMCYAIAHGKRDCFNAWKVCTCLLLLSSSSSPRLLLLVSEINGGRSLTVGHGKHSSTTTKPITANTVRGRVERARRSLAARASSRRRVLRGVL